MFVNGCGWAALGGSDDLQKRFDSTCVSSTFFSLLLLLVLFVRLFVSSLLFVMLILMYAFIVLMLF